MKKRFIKIVIIANFLLLAHPGSGFAQITNCDCGPCGSAFCAANCPGGSACVWCEGGSCNFGCDCCSSCGGGGSACFTGETPISMADDSEKPIAEVEVGEMVKSFDPETEEIAESKVEEVYEHPAEETSGYYLLTTETGREIKVTPEHPILAEKTSETASPLELFLLKLKATFLKLLNKVS